MKQAKLWRTLERLRPLLRRRWVNPQFDQVSMIPIDLKMHPAWRSHALFLQDRTALPWPGKTIHAINRIPDSMRGRRYVAETENLFSLLPKSITRTSKFNINKSIELIEQEIHSGFLQRIIFQSPGAWAMNQKWFTPDIESVSRLVQTVPDAIHARTHNTETDQLRILIIGTSIYYKGLFMLPRIVQETRRHRPDVQFTCVISTPLPFLDGTDGIDTIVVPMMDETMRADMYQNHHFVMNLSLGDALGVYLESIRFNTPMITFQGQHADAFVPDGGGFILEQPLFIYGKADFDRHYRVDQFPDYVQQKIQQNFFASAEDDVIELIRGLDLGEDYQAMVTRQYQHGCEHLNVPDWLDSMGRLYSEL